MLVGKHHAQQRTVQNVRASWFICLPVCDLWSVGAIQQSNQKSDRQALRTKRLIYHTCSVCRVQDVAGALFWQIVFARRRARMFPLYIERPTPPIVRIHTTLALVTWQQRIVLRDDIARYRSLHPTSTTAPLQPRAIDVCALVFAAGRRLISLCPLGT